MDPSSAQAELAAYEERLAQLQTRLADLKELAAAEQLAPDQWAEMQEQLVALEARMQEYLGDLVNRPMIFWQAVRFGGLGFLIGILLQRWLCGQI